MLLTVNTDSLVLTNASRPRFVLNDTVSLSLGFQRSNGTGKQLPGTPEIRFICKRPNHFGGKQTLIDGFNFTFNPNDFTYQSQVSFSSPALIAAFLEAQSAIEISTSLTLTREHLYKLLVPTNTAPITITIPSGLFLPSETIHIIRGNTGSVTLSYSGLSITNPENIPLALPAKTPVTISFTSGTAFSLAPSKELQSIALGGEITYRNTLEPTPNWTSIQFSVVVANERFRGDETSPLLFSNPGLYYTAAEVNNLFSTTVFSTANLSPGSVTEPILATNSVTPSKLATNSVTTPALANGSVTRPKLSPDALAKLISTAVLTTSYTFIAEDANQVLLYTGISPATFTIPPNSSVPFPIGTFLEIYQQNTGEVLLAPGAGVTLSALADQNFSSKNGKLSILKTATNTWQALPPLYELNYVTSSITATTPYTIGSVAGSGGTLLTSLKGLPGTTYTFEVKGYYTTSVNTEGLGLFFSSNAALTDFSAGVTLSTAATGTTLTAVRTLADFFGAATSTNAANTSSVIQATGSAGSTTPLKFSISGFVTMSASGTILNIKACTEASGSATILFSNVAFKPVRLS